jgi:hypothetical protein
MKTRGTLREVSATRLILLGLLALAGVFAGCSEGPFRDDGIAMVQYLPLAVVVPQGEELKRAEAYAATHPGHFAYLAVMSHPLSPYGERAGIVARDVDWSELKRGMTVVYLAQKDGMMVGMGAGLLVEKVGDGWTYRSWGYPDVKPNLLTRLAYAGVVVVAFVTERPTLPGDALSSMD